MTFSSGEQSLAADGTKRIILVHGTGHGGWCWYRVATLLRAAGHRVDALDLAASGADPRRLRDAPTFEDYARPLLDALAALPDGERAVLVGHSFGGMSVALAAETFPDKVAAAVFVTAFLPDCTHPRSYVIEQVQTFRLALIRCLYIC
jgi:pimeloyl-ACP methyl ester carboxylesterase